MPAITIPRNYTDTAALTEAQLDAAFDAIETAINTTKLADDNLQDESVGTSELQASAVTAVKLASDSVTTAKILDANVTAAKLASDAVTTAKILDANVTAAKLASDAVTTAKILDANVTTAKLNDGAVTQAKRAALGQQISSSCGSFTTSSTSFVSVTNLSVEITTTGRPVMLLLTPDGTGNSSGVVALDVGGTTVSATLKYLRDATTLCTIDVSVTAGAGLSLSTSVPPAFVEAIAAGTYTYSIQLKAYSGAVIAGLSYVKLVAYEL